MVNHTKKYIAPVVITVCMILLLAVYILLCVLHKLPLVVMVIFGGICLLQIVISVIVLVERIREIRSGEEDDLSKY